MKVQIYEWLKGDGNAWIDLNRLQSADEVVRGKTKHYGVYSQVFVGVFGALDNTNAYTTRALVRRPNGKWAIANFSSGIDAITDDEIVFEFTKDYIKLNNNTYTDSWREGTSRLTEYLFNRHRNDNLDNIYHGSIAYYEVVGKLHLYPCKLLSPFSTHPAGECAMIDVLSNTLYFNQGIGSFTCEGEAGEIIDTTPCYNNIISKESKVAVRLREYIKSNHNDDKIIVDFPLNPNTPIKAKIMLDMSEQYPHNGRHFFRFDNYDYAFYGNGSAGNPIRLGVWSVYSQYNKNYVAKNGATEVEFYSNRVITEFGFFTWDASRMSMILQRHIDDEQCQNIIVGEVWQEGVFHLHPCELALPYGTHQVGEACMIDLLRGNLYFNQGRGPFTCEGAVLGYWQDKPMNDHYCDVEGTLHRSVQIFADNGERLKLIWEKNLPFTTHRWLVGDGVAYVDSGISDSVMDVEFKIKTDKINASEYTKDEWIFGVRNNYRGLMRDMGVMKSSQGMRYFFTNGAARNYLEVNASSVVMKYSENAVWFNEIKFDTPPNEPQGINYGIFDTTNASIQNLKFRGSFAYFKADTLHLTPTALNRPTLPTEDNNGIARKQGEAVFVDYERYKRGLPWCFGNVASSGSFSVSDYLIEGEDYEVISGVNCSYEQVIIFTSYYIYKDTLEVDALALYENSAFLRYYITDQDQIYLGNGRTRDLWSTIGPLSNAISFVNSRKRVLTKFFVEDGKFKVEYDGRIKEGGSDFPREYYPNYCIMKGRFTIFGYKWMRDAMPFIDLRPIRLKKAIEPHTTHNGKGGTAGEIGFFDTISGKFYGNDGSGKFRRYFEEGKDYERVAGVVGSGTQYIDTRIMPSTLEGLVFEYNPLSLYGGDFYFFYFDVDGVSFRSSQSRNVVYVNPNLVVFWDGVRDFAGTITNGKFNLGSIDLDYTNISSTRHLCLWRSASFATISQCAIKRVYIPNIIDLIPIRLLKTAYSTDTHNGREYASGTICFLDQVSGMVYGNDGSGEFGEYIPE